MYSLRKRALTGAASSLEMFGVVVACPAGTDRMRLELRGRFWPAEKKKENESHRDFLLVENALALDSPLLRSRHFRGSLNNTVGQNFSLK